MSGGTVAGAALSLHSVRGKIVALSKVMGVVLIASYIVFVNLPLERDISYVLWIAMVGVMVLAFDFVLRRMVTDPLAELSLAAERFSNLNFSAPSMVRSKDEFGDLSESLNAMAENLKRTIARLEAANAQLEREVERERLLLKERKELVDSLSHEMKTPISIIRAYAEGLEDTEDEAMRHEYVRVITVETERMVDLITALLDLSALENGAVRLRREPFDFVELVETVAGRLLIDVPHADFELAFELPDHPVSIVSDAARMEQVVENLLMNAKNHVKPDGVVRLEVTEIEGAVRFSVFNEGPRIPSEELDRVWDRFYRGRGSASGGSGLGLAIVAQVLSMQDFPYSVANKRGGVLFSFEIPVGD